MDTNDLAGSTGPITISEVAQRYGVTLRALRFYEDRGLMSPRRVGPTRLYDSATIRRLELILKGKNLGFTLSEIRDMVNSRASATDASPDLALSPAQVVAQIELLRRQRLGIEHALEELEATRLRMALINAEYLNSPAAVGEPRAA